MGTIVKDVRRELRKRVPLQGGGEGFTTVPNGHELADIAVFVDEVAIARAYGERAMINKNGCCRFMHGAVIIRVVRRQKVGP